MHQRVVLVPWPYQSHISPMLELGTVLHSKGFSITITHTNFNSISPLKHPNFKFIPICERLTDKDTSLSDLIALVKIFNAKCEAPLKKCLDEIVNEKGSKLVCVIYDGLMYAGATVAKSLQLPSMIFHTVSHTALLANITLLQLYEAGCLPVQGIHPLRFKDLTISNFGTYESLTQLLQISHEATKSSPIICNAIKDLEQSSLESLHQHFQVPIFSIGPLSKISPTSPSTSLFEEDKSCLKWLDKQAPSSVLYVSLGSIVCVDEKELAEMAWGLAHSGQPILWVIRSGFVTGPEKLLLPESFETEVFERGLVVKWAPQKKVLAHEAIGGFWTHCGWNSTLESIWEGVPMMCLPRFGDQKVNTRYVSDVWKVGLEMDGKLERGAIDREVRRLMTEREGEEMRKRAILLKDRVDLCVDKGGCSYNSVNDLAQYLSSL